MGASLDHVLQALNAPDNSLGPQGGNLENPKRLPEARRSPLNAEMIDGLPTLHRFERPDAAVNGNKNEQPWHRLVAYMLLAGQSRKEIAAQAQVAPETISHLRAQRWFQELLAVLANEQGKDIMEVVKSEALASVETLVEIRDDAEASARNRLSAAVALLEHAVGKPTQKVVSSSTVTHLSPADEMAKIQEELRIMRKNTTAPQATME